MEFDLAWPLMLAPRPLPQPSGLADPTNQSDNSQSYAFHSREERTKGLN